MRVLTWTALAFLSATGFLVAGEVDLVSGDWTVTCAAPGKKCQAVTRRGNTSRLILFMSGDTTLLEYKVPSNIDLHKDVDLRIGGVKFHDEVLTCDKQGCFGIVKLSVKALNAMKSGKNLFLDFYDLGDPARLSIQHSLMGFSGSLARLEETRGAAGS